MSKGSHFRYLVGVQYRDNEGKTGFFILFRGFLHFFSFLCPFVFLCLVRFHLSLRNYRASRLYCLLFCTKLKWHTAELLAHTNSWEGCSEPRNLGGELGKTTVLHSCCWPRQPGTGSRNAAREGEPLDWCKRSATALVSWSPSHGRAQHGPRCDGLVHESTFHFLSPCRTCCVDSWQLALIIYVS